MGLMSEGPKDYVPARPVNWSEDHRVEVIKLGNPRPKASLSDLFRRKSTERTKSHEPLRLSLSGLDDHVSVHQRDDSDPHVVVRRLVGGNQQKFDAEMVEGVGWQIRGWLDAGTGAPIRDGIQDVTRHSQEVSAAQDSQSRSLVYVTFPRDARFEGIACSHLDVNADDVVIKQEHGETRVSGVRDGAIIISSGSSRVSVKAAPPSSKTAVKPKLSTMTSDNGKVDVEGDFWLVAHGTQNLTVNGNSLRESMGFGPQDSVPESGAERGPGMDAPVDKADLGEDGGFRVVEDGSSQDASEIDQRVDESEIPTRPSIPPSRRGNSWNRSSANDDLETGNRWDSGGIGF